MASLRLDLDAPAVGAHRAGYVLAEVQVERREVGDLKAGLPQIHDEPARPREIAQALLAGVRHHTDVVFEGRLVGQYPLGRHQKAREVGGVVAHTGRVDSGRALAQGEGLLVLRHDVHVRREDRRRVAVLALEPADDVARGVDEGTVRARLPEPLLNEGGAPSLLAGLRGDLREPS